MDITENGSCPSPDDLRSWCESYLAAGPEGCARDSPLILDIQSDRIDHDDVERQIQKQVLTADVVHGFCGKCRYLLEHWPDFDRASQGHSVGRHFTTNELEAAARAGCKFCSFLISRLDSDKLLDRLRKIESRLNILKNSSLASLSIQRSNENPASPTTLWVNPPGLVVKHWRSVESWAVFNSRLCQPTAGLWLEPVDRFDLSRMWLKRCNEKHSSCRSNKKFERPTRLILVRDNKIKLIPTDTLDTVPEYATLSYCWGPKAFTVLTKANMSSFFEDIPQEILPKTFTDAFRVVEELGLAYIWIDALCIIQKEEDNRDWLHESGRMRSIYGGGYVNIAASSATTVHEGLFSKLKHFNGGFTERVTARVTTSTYCMVKDFRSRDPYKEAVLETPLAKRGWALQEKLLSPRTISWGERGIVWECRTGTKSEFLPNGFSNRLLTKPQLVCPEDQSFDWTEIILQYSMMNLTLASDKLPALSGIARRQYEVTGDDYLAGMWRRDLAYQLAWSKFHPRVERPAWRAPTWSWVSVDGPVRLTQYQSDWGAIEYVRVRDVRTTPSSQDPFGAVTAGELTLACSTLVSGQFYHSESRSKGKPGCLDTENALIGTELKPVPISMDCSESDSTPVEDPVFLLITIGCPREVKLKRKDLESIIIRRDNMSLYGIVLQTCGNIKGHFRRVGSFNYHHSGVIGDNVENNYYHVFMEAMEAGGAHTAEAMCTEVLLNPDPPEFPYVITIE